ncbi:MAG TPA: porin [Kofleriaceae bacterium]|nr:porin [Kofleriaceae bacterium]
MYKSLIVLIALSGSARAQTPPAAPETAKTPTDTAAAVEKPAEAPPPKKLSVGTKGLFNPGLLAQAWLQHDRAGDTTQISQFRLRRAELSVSGEIIPKTVGYKVMFDAAKVRETQKVTVAGPPDAMGNPTTVTINNPTSAVSALQDFYITALSPFVDVSIGQFKIPVSWEGYNSSGKLMFPERAVVSSTFGDKRDLGVRLEKKLATVGYSAGVFNGSGLDNFDTNVQKDVALRLEAYPITGLTVAGVTYDSIGQRDHAGTKDRWEADVRYEAGDVLLQSEAIFARDVTKDAMPATLGRGFYVLGGYTLHDIDSQFHGDLQPVVRVGAFDPDTDLADNALLHFDVGVNYYLIKHEMKVQAAYQRTQFQDSMKPANNELILAAQVMY